MSQTINLPKVRGTYRFNADLSKTSWFRVGGKAEVLFLPKDLDDLQLFLKEKSSEIKATILGACSNVIISDEGIEGVVIKLGGGFNKIAHQNNFLSVGGACLCSNVALYCKINGLTNLEFLTGIPGNIGGAIAMNAGCYDGEIANFLVSATAIDFDGNILQLKNTDFGFKYRGSCLPKNLIFVEGTFKVENSTPEIVGKKIAEFNQKREAAQPIRSRTGGSTFKNPDSKKSGGKKSWQLIDEAGCRGMKLGGAQISEKHCNFMINTGNATAKDLIDLGNLVIDKVKEKSGVVLEWEIKVIGRN
jgi:UDP-N-acetylmuramate dehydrogenase